MKEIAMELCLTLVNGAQPVKEILKPWGKEVILWSYPGGSSGKVLKVNAGHRLSLQYHERKQEVMVCMQGHCHIELDGQVERHFKAGEAVFVHPGMVHRLIAVEDSDIFEISNGDDNDIVRLKDDYDR